MNNDLDINKLLAYVAEGKISVQDLNYILNTSARYTERVHGDTETHK